MHTICIKYVFDMCKICTLYVSSMYTISIKSIHYTYQKIHAIGLINNPDANAQWTPLPPTVHTCHGAVFALTPATQRTTGVEWAGMHAITHRRT